MPISAWSTTAALNVESTGISDTGGGVGIQGTNLVSNFDNALRDIMAQIATFRTAGTIAGFFGQTVIGSTAALSIGGNSDNFEVLGTTAATGGLALAMFNATAGTGAHLDFYRSKNAAIGSATVVASGDNLGEIDWFGAQQTGTFATQNAAAQIKAEVDGVVTSGAGADMPGRLVFSTTPDASGTLTERLRIAADGTVTLHATNSSLVLPQSAAPAPTVEGSMAWDTDDNVLRVGNGSTTTQIGIASGTAVAASGTSVDFTGIPAGAKRITVMFNALSTNGTSVVQLQLGDSGGAENTGYVTTLGSLTGSTPGQNTSTAGVIVPGSAANAIRYGTITFNLLDPSTFTWVATGTALDTITATVSYVVSVKATSAVTDRVRITTVNGTDTFDAGTINVSWE